jgi:hypothetical protein
MVVVLVGAEDLRAMQLERLADARAMRDSRREGRAAK